MTTGYYPDHGAPLGNPPSDPPNRKLGSEGESAEDLRLRAERAEARAQGLEEGIKHAGPKTPPPIDPSKIPPPDPGEMPDIQADPEAYQEWALKVRELDRWEAKNYTDNVKASADRVATSDRILDDYLAERPKYRGLRAQVFAAFKEECLARNLTELPDDASSLNAAVDKRMKALIKEAAAAVDDLPTGDPHTDPKSKGGKQYPPDRSADLSAGSKGSNAGGTPPTDEDHEEIKPLRDVLLDRQAASGFF